METLDVKNEISNFITDDVKLNGQGVSSERIKNQQQFLEDERN